MNIEKTSQLLLEQAILLDATDIHLLPQNNQAKIYFRTSQQLVEMMEITKEKALKLISHFKFIASMDIGEHRRPQNGALELRLLGNYYHLRISSLPTPFFESLVIRILPQNETISLAKLSLFHSITYLLASLCQRANGLIIITGPTGAGKTTTMYAMLYAMKQEQMRNIITLEDPVEKKTDSFIQVEVNEKAGITYFEGLKAILRHDPDVIMIGEIRDEQTAKIAIRAALTGHLVITTMHTKNSFGALTRLVELGISKHDIEQTVIGVIAQRLVQIVCPLCGQTCHKYCRRTKLEKQKAIFEILTGNELQQLVKNSQFHDPSKIRYSLKKQFRKAYALGFITERTFTTWLGENE